MKKNQVELQHFILSQFMTQCNVSESVALQDMNVIMISYAHAALISLIDYPEKDVEALKTMFINEIKNALLAKHSSHECFVKCISTNIYNRAK